MTDDMTDAFRSRYPDYNVLDKVNSPDWDEQTWMAVKERLMLQPAARFFSDAEVCTLTAIVNRIIPQPDRSEGGSVPIVSWIDAKLYHDRRDGYRYEDIPPQREAWRLAIEGFDQTARALHGRAFTELRTELQDDVLSRVERGDPPGTVWRTVAAARFFTHILCVTAVKAYYSHPTAWSEIGYSGPASPRGHVRIWIGGVDPWEAHQRKTLWETE
jgi:hypothetical protein